MKPPIRHDRPAVIQLPHEIDAVNAENVAARLLQAAYGADAVIVADMGKTTFCDSRGTQELLKVHHWALASRCELRFARPTVNVLRVWQLLGADQILTIYPTLAAARALSSRRVGDHAAPGTG
jgi:anti-sigma B factor antagonist